MFCFVFRFHPNVKLNYWSNVLECWMFSNKGSDYQNHRFHGLLGSLKISQTSQLALEFSRLWPSSSLDAAFTPCSSVPSGDLGTFNADFLRLLPQCPCRTLVGGLAPLSWLSQMTDPVSPIVPPLTHSCPLLSCLLLGSREDGLSPLFSAWPDLETVSRPGCLTYLCDAWQRSLQKLPPAARVVIRHCAMNGAIAQRFHRWELTLVLEPCDRSELFNAN